MNRTGLSGADIIVHRLRQQQTDASRASPSAGSSTAYMFAMMQAYCLAIAPSIPAVRIIGTGPLGVVGNLVWLPPVRLVRKASLRAVIDRANAHGLRRTRDQSRLTSRRWLSVSPSM